MFIFGGATYTHVHFGGATYTHVHFWGAESTYTHVHFVWGGEYTRNIYIYIYIFPNRGVLIFIFPLKGF